MAIKFLSSMVASTAKRWLIVLAFAPPLLFHFHTPGYTQELLNPESLLEVDDIAPSHVDNELVPLDLPLMTSASTQSDAVVLVRSTMPVTQRHQSLVLAEIYFDAKRQYLKREAAQIIEESAELLKKDQHSRIQIEAFCDTRGTSAYSLALGRQRALTIAQYFQNLDIPSSQILTSSYGPHHPRCHQNSPTCWQESLRINNVFGLLAMHRPQSGCLTRLRLHHGHNNQSITTPGMHRPFLQHIHLAETR